MNRRFRISLPALLNLALIITSCGFAGADDFPPPHSILKKPAEYHGPERDEPDLDTGDIRIGLFAPIDPVSSVGHRMWCGATLAVEEANAAPGAKEASVRLIQRWATDPWRGGSSLVVRMVYEDQVLGIIGGPDGDTTHILEQIATKIRVPILSPVSSDPSLTRVAVPWIFMLPPDDTAQAALLADTILSDGQRAVALITSTNHDGRTGADAVRKALLEHQIAPVSHVTLPPQIPDVTAAVSRTRRSNPDSLVVWCDPATTKKVLAHCRDVGFQPRLYLPLSPDTFDVCSKPGLWAAKTTCLEIEQKTVNSVQKETLDRAFVRRFGFPPDRVSCLTYDATRLLITAVRRAGLNRARVRDELASPSGFDGVFGKVIWDNGGANVGFTLAALVNGPPSGP